MTYHATCHCERCKDRYPKVDRVLAAARAVSVILRASSWMSSAFSELLAAIDALDAPEPAWKLCSLAFQEKGRMAVQYTIQSTRGLDSINVYCWSQRDAEWLVAGMNALAKQEKRP